MQTFLPYPDPDDLADNMKITLTQLQKELLQEIIEQEILEMEATGPWAAGGKPQVFRSLRSLLAKLRELK
jgi:hypothetical protein